MWLSSKSLVTRRIRGILPFKVVIIKIDCSNRVTIDLASLKPEFVTVFSYSVAFDNSEDRIAFHL